MDFATRDRYRHAVEQIARRSTLVGAEVAAKAVELARNARLTPTDPRTAHVGYYLSTRACRRWRARWPSSVLRSTRCAAFGRRYPLPIYLGTIVAITGALTAGLARAAIRGSPNRATLHRSHCCVGQPVVVAGDQPARGLARQLARHAAGDAAAVAADGLLEGIAPKRARWWWSRRC